MNDTTRDFGKTYSKMADDELLRLSAEYDTLLPVARAALAAELQRRVIEKPAQRIESPKWTNVEMPRRLDGIHFPKMCPNCLRPDLAAGISFDSLSHAKFRFTHVRHDYLSIKIPHCDRCRRLVVRRRRQVTAYLIAAAALSFGLGIWMESYRLVPILLFAVLSVPVTWVFRSTESIALGDYDDKFIAFRFRNREYAEAFKKINGVSEADIATEQITEILKAYSRVSGAK